MMPNSVSAVLLHFWSVCDCRIDLTVSRVGGAFGGKGEFAPLTAILAAVASYQTHRYVYYTFIH